MSISCHDIQLSLDPTGRRLDFTQELLNNVHLYRRVGAQAAWQPVAINARSPFVDGEVLPAGTVVEYCVQYVNPHGKETSRSNVVSTTD